MPNSVVPIASDRPQHTPPLPPTWTKTHDRAICVLDARNYTLLQSIKKLRRAFPELVGMVLTTTMVDKRLRVLDQNIEIEYFKVGLDLSSWRSKPESSAVEDDMSSSQSATTMINAAEKAKIARLGSSVKPARSALKENITIANETPKHEDHRDRQSTLSFDGIYIDRETQVSGTRSL